MVNSTIKLLAIDDLQDNLISLKAMISEAFPQALFFSALSGAKGLELARTEDPDVILLDILMPGMDGFEVCQKLKADSRTCEIPVVFITAMQKDKNNHIRALDVGAEAFLAKPLDASELTAQIKAMVKIKHAVIEKRSEKERLAALVELQTSELKKNYIATMNLLEDLNKENEARKQSEMALQKSQERYHDLFTGSRDGVVVVDDQGRFLEANDAYCQMLGYSLQELAEMKNFYEITPAKWCQWEETEIWNKRLMHDGYSQLYEKEYIRKDGTIFPIEMQAFTIYTPDNGSKLVWGVIRDITERKQAEKVLKTSEIKFRSIINASPVAMALNDEQQHITLLNEAFIKLFGYTLEDIPTLDNWWIQAYPDIQYRQKVIAEWQARIKLTNRPGADFSAMEVVVRCKNGTDRTVLVSATCFDDSQSSNHLVVFYDITERKQIENELLIAKKRAEESDQLKSAFLNNLSHEIRTPFNAILGFLAMLHDHTLPANERDEYIGIIDQSAERLMNTINDTVEMAKIQTGQLKLTERETDISSLLCDVLEHFKPQAELKGLNFILKKRQPDLRFHIKTDPDKLKSILSCLINNAIKFTSRGSIELDLRDSDGCLEFAVKDTGIGIPANKHQAIFELFMQADVSNTRKFEGSGLGLSIAKAYVEMLGGHIWLESKVEAGTTFYFTIPYQYINVRQTSASIVAPNQAIPAPHALKVLVAEDDDFNFEYIKAILNKAKYVILHACTGAEAIELYRNNPDTDIILMDIKMPDMDGYNSAREIRKLNASVPIIAVTAYAATGDRQKCLQAGMNDYISKPVTPQNLLLVLDKWRSKT